MIAKLIGLVDNITADFVILNVGGVGYRVFCSSKTLNALPRSGQTASLWIETQVREDHIHLFGFSNEEEKAWFEKLTTVQGVGARVGLAILSALSPEELSLAFTTADAKALTRANGVGPKLAARIVSELKGKTVLPSVSGFSTSISASSVLEEATSALVNLGYSRSETGLIIAKVYEQNKNLDVGALISLTLQEIGKNKI
ncbi:MAG: Holliday junction branch migration protein RuvA [Alphaproteobacteria bacterium]|nr:Holliday junction branch migration protein RuvA [Alphaproteobacteria bacterium]